ncbi:MAG: ABC transporter ATP-binding protein [Dongiaceae bacterium]
MADRDLRLEAISKVYGNLAAVTPTSLTIPKGEFFALLGPSGSGKTTLLMMIAGFVAPTDGALYLGGKPITDDPPEARNFGMVFQGYALFPHMTVRENVRFPLWVRKIAEPEASKRIRNALELVKLEHLADRLPRTLSGGQQQRVALARALVYQPEILLLDEPLGALDRKLRGEVQGELKALHAKLGTTFIYVTHDQDEALSMSDRVAVMRNGEVLQNGTPRELYERPETKFVADFLGESNFITGEVSGWEGGTLVYRAGGELLRQATADRSLSPGQRITLAVRPERIVASPQRNGEGNWLSGRIEAWSYLGKYIGLKVRTDAVGSVNLTMPGWTSDEALVPDKPIWLNWNPGAPVIVRDDR